MPTLSIQRQTDTLRETIDDAVKLAGEKLSAEFGDALDLRAPTIVVCHSQELGLLIPPGHGPFAAACRVLDPKCSDRCAVVIPRESVEALTPGRDRGGQAPGQPRRLRETADAGLLSQLTTAILDGLAEAFSDPSAQRWSSELGVPAGPPLGRADSVEQVLKWTGIDGEVVTAHVKCRRSGIAEEAPLWCILCLHNLEDALQ